MEAGSEKRAKSIFDSVLKDIKPTPNDVKEMTYNVNRLMERLGKVAGKNVELRVEGSIAKGTYLKGDADVDVFMLFKRGTGKEELEKKAIEYGKKLATDKKDYYRVKYAEHPYVRLYMNSINVNADLVPATKIDNPEELATTVDRTPFHTEFILKNMTGRQKDDTRVLKYLLKMHNIYGAEVKTSGFSGYLCELLIHTFGSLYRLLEYMTIAEDKIVLLPKEKKEGSIEHTKRFNTDFVVIDPVDSNRNVAAGVSRESLARFILVSKLFIRKPSRSIFEQAGSRDAITLSSFIRETNLDVHAVIIKVGEESEDVIWPQLRKTANIICDRASQLGFHIYMHAEALEGREGIMAFIAPKEELGSRVIKGPSASMGNAPLKFIEAHGNASGFIFEGNSINAIERSQCATFMELLKEISKGRQIPERKNMSMDSAKVFSNKSIHAKHAKIIAKQIAKKLQI